MNPGQARFSCGDITLEGEWYLPSGKGPFPGVVICHPHPLYGGDMLNNIVSGIFNELPQQAIAAFRFNFRGVGASEGEFGGGIAEQEDVRAALAFFLSLPDINPQRIGLAGYSFGAGVALPVALQGERVKLLALVSPALSDSGWEQLKGYHKPKCLVIGDSDSVISPERFRRQVKNTSESGTYRIVAGADHFWSGYETEVAQEVTRFFISGFQAGLTA